ncbi:MAG: aminomethyl-transferring glycine dehydrogenase subunit GcvPB [Leptospirales bacterium]
MKEGNSTNTSTGLGEADARPEMEPSLWSLSRPGARGVRPAPSQLGEGASRIPSHLCRNRSLGLPELSELETVRHFTHLSQLSRGVDTHFYPLGSCTMKYNPKVMDRVPALQGFSDLHPLTDEEGMQGYLEALWTLAELLKEVLGMDAVTLAPAAGAHGELTGILLARKYFESRNEPGRTEILVPDSAHGTNPASASMGGFTVRTVPSNSSGHIDLALLDGALSDRTALVMITAPSTLGLFEEELSEVVRKVRAKGALLYMDGANMNAFLGVLRPGDLGFDIVHINTHKTLATPHGGGGPGSGPVGVKGFLAPFLPNPRIVRKEDRFSLEESPESVGKIRSFLGSSGVLLRALAYMRMLGEEGLRRVALYALLNANYLRKRLEGVLPGTGEGLCTHEFVLSARTLEKNGIRAIDLAKALLDCGYYAPTVYFPLIVPEALMIEPTECESRSMLDRFADDFIRVVGLSRTDPDALHRAPSKTPVSRPDEVRAARDPVLVDPFRDRIH